MFPLLQSKPGEQLSFYFTYDHPISKRTKMHMVCTAGKEGTEPVLPLLIFFESKQFIYSVRNVHSRETEQHYLNIVM